MKNSLFLIVLTCLCAFTLFPPNAFAQNDSPEYVVRAIYFIPKDREPDPNMYKQFGTLAKGVQQFYADQMEAHGFGRKTFTLETDESGKILVHHVKGEFDEAYYRDENFGNALIEIDTKFGSSKNINLVIVDTNSNFGGFATVDGSGGNAVISAATNDVISVSAHELGHVFDLEHDWRNESYIMTYAEHPSVLSGCAAEWLDAHKYFNPTNRTFNDNTTVKMLMPELITSPAAIRLQFEIADPDGLHQAQLILPSEQGPSLFGCKSLNEDSVIIEFVTTELLAIESGIISLNVIDSQGNIKLCPFQIDITAILPDSEPVSIPDVNLAAVVRETLGLAPNSPITQLDILKLTRLEVWENLNISDLTGLEHATHLQILTLAVNQIQDMTPLTKLAKLKRVTLNNNQLSNIPSLVGMKHLTTLYLSDNQISDITPLQELTQLTDLAIGGNPINTENLLSVLTQLTRLRTLLLYGRKISDITPLAKLTQLRTLGLTWNPISDITPLAALTNLRNLYLSECQISDITALKGLEQLRHLFLDDNQISDVKPLAELVNLKELSLVGNPIKDKEPLLELLRKNPEVKIYYDEPLTVLEPPQRTEDVNGDGVVNIQDLVQVAGALGEAGPNTADVNGDGVVNIQDLVQVAGALGNAAAAPPKN